ncbi:hypothetical protein ACP70R_022606 [Stipagrostis hirtigluma subsp. patula]
MRRFLPKNGGGGVENGGRFGGGVALEVIELVVPTPRGRGVPRGPRRGARRGAVRGELPARRRHAAGLVRHPRGRRA